MNSYLLGTISSILFLGFLLLIEYITRKNDYPKEFTRRITHVSSGLFAGVMGIVLEPMVFIIFLVLFLTIIILSYRVKFFSSIHNVKRETYGELFFPLGILIAYIISSGSTNNYFASVMILSISDPLAGAVGDISKRKPSYGSITFFASTLFILLVIFKFEHFVIIIIIASIVTIVERTSSYGTDNLTIPLASVLLLKFLL